jgi:hypothetical protein
VRKDEFVKPFYRRLKGAEGVACVLTSLELGRTFVSYTPRFTVRSGDATYRRITACRKRFLHYYWYLLDPVMGPMSVRVASYFPFNVTCYLNGRRRSSRKSSPAPACASARSAMRLSPWRMWPHCRPPASA